MRKLAAAIALIVAAGPTLAIAQLRGVRADLAPIAESDAVRGGSARIALQVAVPQGFHLQSDAPRDPLLIPTVLTIDAPSGVRVAEVVYPEATDFTLAGQSEPLAVFEHAFAVGVRLEIGADVATGPLELPARFRYQACDDKLCFAPVTADVRWTLNVVGSGAPRDRQYAEVFDRIAFGTGRPPDAATAVPLPSFPPIEAGPRSTEKLDDFTIVSTAGGYLGTDDFLQFVRNAENGVKERGLFEGRGPLAIMLLVLLGGLALNLTPCVLPMIPINLSIIGAGSRSRSRASGFLLGGVYGAAMALVYGILGVIVIVTAGTFGTINASPWFNLAIAIVFVALALAMFDVLTIDFSRFGGSIGVGQSRRGSLMLAFGMGALAALLAGACVAPVVIQVVLFSSNLYAQGTTAALALPFLLGIGMAVPWPLAGAGLTALPKPGAWMVRVKQALGAIILATAAYYGYLAYTLFADRWVDPGAVSSSVEEKVKAGWHSSLAEGLAVAQREQKPVLIDMWATWCKNCLTMDRTTLADPAVVSALDGYVKIKFQAEQPDEEPARSIMERFGAIGLPTYAIIRPPAKSE
jgi:cytochrome c biogenesis protein CcdA/thiol-disulfide isomerase/thioredoxin